MSCKPIAVLMGLCAWGTLFAGCSMPDPAVSRIRYNGWTRSFEVMTTADQKAKIKKLEYGRDAFGLRTLKAEEITFEHEPSITNKEFTLWAQEWTRQMAVSNEAILGVTQRITGMLESTLPIALRGYPTTIQTPIGSIQQQPLPLRPVATQPSQ